MMGINPLDEPLKIEVMGNMAHFKTAMKKVKETGKSAALSVKKHFKTNMKKVEKSADKAATRIEKKVGKSITKVTKKAAKLGTVGAAAFAAFSSVYAVKEAMKVETAITNLNTLLFDSIDPISEYKAAISDLSYEMGIGLVETTDAYYQAVSAGFDDLKEASDVAQAAAKAAIGGMTELPTSVEAITRVLNSYKLETSEAMNASDMLFNTVKYGVTTFAELAPLIGEVAGAAGAANLPMEQLFGTLATLTKGMKTPQAVSSMNAIIASFISPAKEASDAAKKFGIDLSATALSTGQFANELLKISKLGPEAIATLFPNRIAVKGVFQIASDNAKSLLETIQNVKDGAGQTDKAFEAQDKTMAQTFKKLRTAVDNAFTKFGEGLHPALEDVTKWFNENKETVKEWGDLIGKAGKVVGETIKGMYSVPGGSKLTSDGQAIIGGGIDPEFKELEKLHEDLVSRAKVLEKELKKPLEELYRFELETITKLIKEYEEGSDRFQEIAEKADYSLGDLAPDMHLETVDKFLVKLKDVEKVISEMDLQMWTDEEFKEWHDDMRGIGKTAKETKKTFDEMINPYETKKRMKEISDLVDDMKYRYEKISEVWGEVLADGTKKGWENEFPQLEKWILDSIESMKENISEALTFKVYFEGGSKTYNAKQWGGYAQELASSGYVQGMPGPDMVPTYLTAKEAVISAPVAQDPRNKPLVDNLIAQGQAGATHHDLSTINITANERITKEMFEDEIIPMIVDAKRDGRLSWGLSY